MKESREISERAGRLPPSPIRRLFRAALKMEAEGERVVRLDIGDPYLPMPGRIAEAITQALKEGKTRYSPMAGLPQLRQAVARHLQRKGLDCDPQCIVVTQGATQGLNASIQLAADAGRALLMPEVYWPNYLQQLCLSGVQPCFYSLSDSFQPRLEEFEKFQTELLSAVLINSPSNPTGAVFDAQAVAWIYRWAAENGLWILSDEAYTDFVFEGRALSPLEVDQEHSPQERRVLGIYSFSKSFAATGLRMGWVVCPDSRTAKRLALLNEPLTGSLTTPLQWGMVAALEVDDTAERREVLRSLRDRTGRLLSDAGIEVEPPAGGLFYFLDISSTGMKSDEFCDRLLEEEKVALVPGSGFGLAPIDSDPGFRPQPRADRCVRLCFAVPEADLQEGIPRLASFIRRSITSGVGSSR